MELHFSPGAYTCGQKKKDPKGLGYRSQMKEKKVREPLQPVASLATLACLILFCVAPPTNGNVLYIGAATDCCCYGL